jgi:hypothetical protein
MIRTSSVYKHPAAAITLHCCPANSALKEGTMADPPSVAKLKEALDKALLDAVNLQFRALYTAYGFKDADKAKGLKTFRTNLDLMCGAYRDAASEIENTTTVASAKPK